MTTSISLAWLHRNKCDSLTYNPLGLNSITDLASQFSNPVLTYMWFLATTSPYCKLIFSSICYSLLLIPMQFLVSTHANLIALTTISLKILSSMARKFMTTERYCAICSKSLSSNNHDHIVIIRVKYLDPISSSNANQFGYRNSFIYDHFIR